MTKTSHWIAFLLLATLLLPFSAVARPVAQDARDQVYIVELQDPAVPSYDGQALSAPLADGRSSLQATNPQKNGDSKLRANAPNAREYFQYLENRHETFRAEASARLSRSIQPERQYQYALNGMAIRLTPAEAQELAQSPMVKSVQPDRTYRLTTDAGPEWLGADFVWNGQTGGNGSGQGEGVVVGIIDSGINWEHPSFTDPSPDGYNFSNPYGQQLGLCGLGEVDCNDKLVGVYDFVTDNPGTPDEEENTNGRDNTGHGSHVAGIAVGNRVAVQLGGEVVEISGVAPRANLVAYRVCFIGDPSDPSGGACQSSAILDAIDQAIEDGVDVINYSIGTNAFNPWAGGNTPRAFLNARNAGIVTVTSAGNSGPNPSTIGSPGNSPWMLVVGNATHNRIFGSVVEDLSGGNTSPPQDLIGASFTDGIGPREIVHAADFGFPLCGVGSAESQTTCDGNTGQSNPWAGNPVFNGEIVVCDRGTYGRVEKGKNLQLAGAGGYILANTNQQGESIVADDHCLPATHVGDSDGDDLRSWLGSGAGHQGSISGFSLVEADEFGDLLASGSSRGPLESPVEDILKPDVIAPGKEILSAWFEGEEFTLLSGTSMSSPHVAGGAALLKDLHPNWSPSQIISAIQTTATPELATNETGASANPHQQGGGRPRLDVAADAGLFLDVSEDDFNNANPGIGGDPKDLNLFGLVDSACRGNCSFTRTVTDQKGGANWTATAIEFPDDVDVTISPSQFNLGDGDSQELTIEAGLRGSGLIGEWVYGRIRLNAIGMPSQYLTVAVFYDADSLPEDWTINTDQGAGWTEGSFELQASLPDATFNSGGLVRATTTVETIVLDPTASNPQPENEDPFDGGEGTFTVWQEVPTDALWLHARTLESTSNDLDLFVGRDLNENGVTDPAELICESISPTDIEQCDLFTPQAGDYWIIVQNWDTDNVDGDEATLVSGVVGSKDSSSLVVSGPGIVAEQEEFDLRLSWSNINALPGEQWLGAVGMGTDRANPNNVGVIPVYFNRNGIAPAQTLPLMAGRQHKLALDGNSNHDRMYIDVPPGVTSMSVSTNGRGQQQSNNLALEVYLEDFDDALETPPFVQLPGGLQSIGSATGSDGTGPNLTINDSVPPGRYFLDLSNTRNNASAVTVEVTLLSDFSEFDPHKGLWDFNRNIFQGAEWNSVGDSSFMVWYAYELNGKPVWYIAAGASPQGNVWVADLLRVTNDGAEQQEKQVGVVSLTFLADSEVVFSYSLFGESGFDPMRPNGPNTCPNISGSERSYTGHWYRGVPGLGGATVLNYDSAQAQVHYLFDASGVPRWVLAADDDNQSSTATEIPLLQFDGFCSLCSPETVTFETVGLVTRNFADETSGNWTLDFVLDPPLVQSIDRTDDIIKLSDTLDCQ